MLAAVLARLDMQRAAERVVGKLGARPFNHCVKGLRAAAAIDRHHPPFDREPAENGNPLQLALEDEDGIVEQRQQRKSFPCGLML